MSPSHSDNPQSKSDGHHDWQTLWNGCHCQAGGREGGRREEGGGEVYNLGLISLKNFSQLFFGAWSTLPTYVDTWLQWWTWRGDVFPATSPATWCIRWWGESRTTAASRECSCSFAAESLGSLRFASSEIHSQTPSPLQLLLLPPGWWGRGLCVCERERDREREREVDGTLEENSRCFASHWTPQQSPAEQATSFPYLQPNCNSFLPSINTECGYFQETKSNTPWFVVTHQWKTFGNKIV